MVTVVLLVLLLLSGENGRVLCLALASTARTFLITRLISHLRLTLAPLQLPSRRAAISISRFERQDEWLRFSRVIISPFL